MTYTELAEQIAKMPKERQLDDVSISLDLAEEIISGNDLVRVGKHDWALGVLDEGHFVISVSF